MKETGLSYKTQRQIAAEFGISERTWRRWKKKINLVLPKGLLSPSWQKLIYETMFYPEGVEPIRYENVKPPPNNPNKIIA